MKITSPINKLEEVEPLIKAGANEFYLGYLNSETKGGKASDLLNRRSYLSASVNSRDELERIVAKSHKYAVPVFVTFNEHSYSEQQKPRILRLLKDVITAEADGVIVGDPGLMLFIKKQKLKIRLICSVAGGVFNSATSDFYKSLGATRIILPRWLKVEEIKALINKSPHVEYEAFILNARCHFSDCYCNLFHPTKSNDFFCKNINSLKVLNLSGEELTNPQLNQHLAEYKQWNRFCPGSKYANKEHCGLCAIPYLKSSGVTSLKIVGRSRPTDEKIKNVLILRECLQLAEKNSAKKYQIITRKLVGENCGRPYSCYYPDILQ